MRIDRKIGKAGLAALLLVGLAACAGSSDRVEDAGADGGVTGDAGPTRDAGGADGGLEGDAGRPRDGGSDAGVDPGALPLLPAGAHLGVIVGFEPLPNPTRQEADDLWQAAMDAGMRTGRVQLDWASVELGPGVYDRGALTEALAALEADGLGAFVGIYAIDSEGPTLPSDLMDPGSATGLADGRSMDDPEILARYRAMLDWAVPIIVDRGGYVLSVANEPDGYMEDRPGEADAVVAFFGAARDHAHTVDPRLAITVTLTAGPIDAEKFFHDDVMAVVDVATYNYYCLTLTDRFVLRAPLEQTVPADLDALVEASPGKQLLLQELGCPAGWPDRPSTIGTSTAAQAEFFRRAFSGIRDRPRIRAAYVFQLVDWSEQLTRDSYIDPLRAEGLPEPFLDSFAEWLQTVGLITYEDGRPRPAWSVFLSALPDF